MIGQNAGAGQPLPILVHRLALIVRFGRNLVRGCDRLCLGFGEAGATFIGQRVERHPVQAVTGGADFLVDLEATLQGSAVVRAERPFKGEGHILDRARIGAGGKRRCRYGKKCNNGKP